MLGIWITDNHEELLKLNYEKIMDKMEVTYKRWSNRNTSLLAKIMLVNSLVGSLFVYKMMVLPTPPLNILQQFKKATESFIWNGARPKIRYEVLKLNKHEGGLNLVDLTIKSLALKVSWPFTLELDHKLANTR